MAATHPSGKYVGGEKKIEEARQKRTKKNNDEYGSSVQRSRLRVTAATDATSVERSNYVVSCLKHFGIIHPCLLYKTGKRYSGRDVKLTTHLQLCRGQEYVCIHPFPIRLHDVALTKKLNSVAFSPQANYTDRRLLAKLVTTFADRGCRVVSATVPPGR
jgi:hypothetical protein